MAIKIKGNTVITDEEILDIAGGAEIGGALSVGLDGYFNGAKLFGDTKEMIRFNDQWLRLNEAGQFTSGIYTPGKFRTDGGLQINGNFVIDSARNLTNLANNSGELTMSSDVLKLHIGGTEQDTIDLGLTGLTKNLSYTSETYYFQENQSEHTLSLGVSSTNGVCFITRTIGSAPTVTDGDNVGCRTYISGSTWRLGIDGGDGGVNDHGCGARCLTWETW